LVAGEAASSVGNVAIETRFVEAQQTNLIKLTEAICFELSLSLASSRKCCEFSLAFLFFLFPFFKEIFSYSLIQCVLTFYIIN